MCLVIDACCLAKVFDGNNHEHSDFVPVLNWITIGKGRMIYGGTKYKTELAQASRFLRMVVNLERAGKTIRVPDDAVDEIASALKAKVTDPEFDDEHLVALVIVSRCLVVCTIDHIAMRYLKRKDMYSGYSVKKPRIYSSQRNANLCCEKHLIKSPLHQN
jgi:hypothetical protein